MYDYDQLLLATVLLKLQCCAKILKLVDAANTSAQYKGLI